MGAAAISDDGFPGCPPQFPAIAQASPRSRLTATLRRIDGWGPRAWREVLGIWRLRHGAVSFEETESGMGDDDGAIACHLILDRLALGAVGASDADAVATCDWVLRRAWPELVAKAGITASTYRPGPAIRASNACFLHRVGAGPANLYLRLAIRFPYAGMCCDGRRLSRFIRRLETFAGTLCVRRARPGLAAHRRAVAVQQALRAALPGRGLIAFLADGSRLARDAHSAAAPRCRPLRSPTALRTTIDLGPLGRHVGMGIRAGITAVAGAPYHGKSTLVAAIAAGVCDHPPGDGRERVVALPSAVAVEADDGRRIKRQDLRAFFSKLPAADARRFETERASGATSMAASVLQACAAGCRLLLVDEDSAASNFLAIDAGMRRLLGRSLAGVTTLLEALPALARQGVSTVLVAGSSASSLAVADQVLVMDHFQPRLVRRPRGARAPTVRGFQVPARVLDDDAGCILGPRHFVDVLAAEPERPVLAGEIVDLRRSGWELDAALARGACSAAAWCARLAEDRPLAMAALRLRYEAFIAARGPCGLDPFHTMLIAVPPWQLVVSVIERLRRPRCASTTRRARNGG